MVIPANNSAIGNTTNHGVSASRTLTGVTGVVDNSPTNITVTFTVGSTSYQSTLDIVSYSVASGAMTYNSPYEIISSTGVATHPGDTGFRLIANRFLFQMGLTTNPEYYT